MADIDTAKLTSILSSGDAEGATPAGKGQALEKAIRYAFEQIPGVSCSMQDQRNGFQTEEIDLLFSNVGHEDGLAQLEPDLLVEAKNWKAQVGAIEINWFATKMRRRNRRTGVLVAACGITGEPETLTAARQQIVLALNEGQEVLVVTRAELEAVSTGERLAQLLLKKRQELIARQDIYVADPSELRSRSGKMRRGLRAFEEIIRGQRLELVQEAVERNADLPQDTLERARALQSALDVVGPLVRERQADEDLDPMWDQVRDALMSAAGICVAWLSDLGFTTANTILVNLAMNGDPPRISVVSRQWVLFTGYYADELSQSKPEQPREGLLFSLTGILIEEIFAIDDYSPEPDDY